MAKDPAISSSDRELFQAEMEQVRPLRRDKVMAHRPRPPARPRQTERDQGQVLEDMMSDTLDAAELETGEELWFARPGLQHTLLRKLRRGQLSVSAELDLHGMTTATARPALAAFLQRCGAAGLRCVRVIHGKGHRSHQKQPVLKRKVDHWLRQREEVLAFCSARPVDGGTGAVYVLLRRR